MKTVSKIMTKPSYFFLFCISVVCGSIIAFSLMWLFGIEISTIDRFYVFPEQWTMLELVWNGTAGIIIFGAIRAVYVALHGHFYGYSSEKPPNSQVGG
jgi:hypothetical protein